MAQYFLFSNLYGAMFLGVYYTLLSNKKSHVWNRIFLLCASLLSLILPLIKLNLSLFFKDQTEVKNPLLSTLNQIDIAQNQTNSYFAINNYWYWLYGGLVFFLLGKILFELILLKKQLQKGDYRIINNRKVYLNTKFGPGSFWKTIFFPNEEIQPEIHTEARRGAHQSPTSFRPSFLLFNSIYFLLCFADILI